MTEIKTKNPVYPFDAIINQEKTKTALILNAINPKIGGVLISGPKGTGKSLLVHSFSEILPFIEYTYGCPYHCNLDDVTNMCQNCLTKALNSENNKKEKTIMKIVKVPISITDDMLIGSVDVKKVVEIGEKAFKSGLLAEANQNILYIDEVNLLPDHITDSILDAAASGWNTVTHPDSY
jgi:Mg-chelatase subunit ChlI